jgi:hypothetical protein
VDAQNGLSAENLMRSRAIHRLAAVALMHVGCDPKPPAPTRPTVDVSVPVSPTSEAAPPSVPSAQPASGPDTLACSCDVLDFESDGPPKGRCTLVFATDGAATLTGTTSRTKLSAQLTPIPRSPDREERAVDYVFEGEFDLACREDWCGKKKLSVLQVREHDYRIVVARSPDGPPSQVLWVTCWKE